jgi:hypothetical protein
VTGASATEQFRAVVDRAPRIWQSVDLRVLGVRVDGTWRNLISRAFLRPQAVSRVPRAPFLPNRPYLRAWQVVRPIGALEEMLAEQQQAQMTLRGEEVWFQKGEFYKPPFHPYPFTGFSQILANPGAGYERPPWPGYKLIGYGDDAAGLVQRTPGGSLGIAAVLQDLPRPCRSLEELAMLVLGKTEWSSFTNGALAEWYAPFEARIALDDTDLRAGQLRYRVELGSRRVLPHVQLFVHGRENEDKRPHKAKRPLPVASLTPKRVSGGGYAVSFERALPGMTAITLTLRVGEEPVQWVDLEDYKTNGRNARLTLYEVVDPDTEVLLKNLFPTTDAQKNKFESAVGRLFVLAGFQVDLLAGDKRLDDGVDALAHDGASARCLAIECTTGSLNTGGKIGKLVKRVGELTRGAPGIRVQGILVAGVPRADLAATELAAARAEGLWVLHIEGLREIMRMTKRAAPVREVMAFLERCRP